MLEITRKQLRQIINRNPNRVVLVPVNQSHEILRHESPTYTLCNKDGLVADIYRIENHIYTKEDELKINVYYIVQATQEIKIKGLIKCSYVRILDYNNEARQTDLTYSVQGKGYAQRRYILRLKIYNLISEIIKYDKEV